MGILFLLFYSATLEGEAAPQFGGTLVVGKVWDALTLDPGVAMDGESFIVIANIYDTLVEYDDAGRLAPGLATSWSASSDYRAWVFTLRSSVYFHDGSPFDAGAVKFNIDRWLNSGNPYHFPSYGRFSAPGALLGGGRPLVERVSASEPHTVRMSLSSPCPWLPAIFAQIPTAMVSPEAVRKYHHDYLDHPTGTGSFRLVEWRRDKRIILQANSGAWRGKPYLDRIIFQPVWGGEARRRLIERGGIDVSFSLRPEDAVELKRLDTTVIQQQRSLNLCFLAFNCEKAPFNDPRVRQAFHYAIRKKNILKYLFLSHGVQADSFAGDLPGQKPHEYNPRKARHLLGEAKCPNLRCTLYYPIISRPYVPNAGGVAEDLREQLDKVGVKLALHGLPWDDYVATLRYAKHDLALWGWEGGDVESYINLALAFDQDSSTKGGTNVAHFTSRELKSLLEALGESSQRSEQDRAIRRIEEFLGRESPVIPLVYYRNLLCQAKRVHGIRLADQGLVRFREVWLER